MFDIEYSVVTSDVIKSFDCTYILIALVISEGSDKSAQLHAIQYHNKSMHQCIATPLVKDMNYFLRLSFWLQCLPI